MKLRAEGLVLAVILASMASVFTMITPAFAQCGTCTSGGSTGSTGFTITSSGSLTYSPANGSITQPANPAAPPQPTTAASCVGDYYESYGVGLSGITVEYQSGINTLGWVSIYR